MSSSLSNKTISSISHTCACKNFEKYDILLSQNAAILKKLEENTIEIQHLKKQLNEKSYVFKMNNANKLFINSKWHKNPSRFYDWTNLNFSDIDVLTYITSHLDDAMYNIKEYDNHEYIHEYIHKYNDEYKNEHNNSLICDIIKAVGCNSDIQLNIKGYNKVSFAMHYAHIVFFHMIKSINNEKQSDTYERFKSGKRRPFFNKYIWLFNLIGLIELKNYISASTKEYIHTFFMRQYDTAPKSMLEANKSNFFGELYYGVYIYEGCDISNINAYLEQLKCYADIFK